MFLPAVRSSDSGRMLFCAHSSGEQTTNKQIKHNNQMKKQNTKTNEMQERAKYTPASVRVVSLTAGNIICGSGGINNMTIDGDEGDNF